MGAWVEQVHQRASLIHEQIAALRRVAPAAEINADVAVIPFQRLLEKLYLEELPYARVLDDSDLVIHAEGRATETEEPRVSALAHLLEQLRDETRKLARTIAGFSKQEHVDNIDLLLSGLAHGSLVVGLKVAPPVQDPRQASMPFLSEDEPVFQAIRSAIRALSQIPHFITEEGVSDDIVDEIPDPALRDATLVALKRLSPSGRAGIDKIELSSPGKREHGELTNVDRRILQKAIAQPRIRRHGQGTFIGVVRELDLDALRFQIRQVENIGNMRCIYSSMGVEDARRWLGREVKVFGQYEADPSGKPRLLKVDKIRVLRERKTRKLDLG